MVCARCQPPTHAHFAAIEQARLLAQRVVVLVLNADDALSPANPFDNTTRRALLAAGMGNAPVTIVMLRDRRYEPLRWATAAGDAVHAAAGNGAVVALADRSTASTSLPLASHWQPAPGEVDLAAAESAARACLFGASGPDWVGLATLVPAAVGQALRAIVASPAFVPIAAEAAFLAQQRQAWRAAPYAPTFVTVDTVATWRDQVLLIQRGRQPGLGQWALPGGFIDLNETLATSCLRELREETGITLAESAIRGHRVFDDPLRSLRGRTITHVYRFVLDELSAPPLAVGADDAAAAAWVPITDLQPERLFDDHYFVLQTLLGLD